MVVAPWASQVVEFGQVLILLVGCVCCAVTALTCANTPPPIASTGALLNR